MWSKILSIEISLLIILYGYALARYTRCWSHPAVIYAVFWFFMTMAPLVFIQSVPITPWALTFILATIVAFGLPAFCYDWSQSVAMARSRHVSVLTYNSLLPIFFGLQLCAIIFVGTNLLIQGFSFSQIVSAPINSANQYMSLRYSGKVSSNIFMQGGIIFNYVAASLAGLTIERQKKRSMIIAIMFFAITPSLMHMAFYADKGTLFLAASYFYGGLLVNRVMRGDTSLLNKTTVKAGLIAAITLFPIIIFAMISRQGEYSLFYVLSSYAFGHLYAFSDWFGGFYGIAPTLNAYSTPADPTWGYWTFMGIGKLIFPAYQLPPGYWAEYLKTSEIQTNIYTFYRGLIYDYGLVGALVFMIIMGAISSAAYNAMLRRATPSISQAYFISLMGFIYTSYIISLFIWNSAYIAAIVVTLLLMANNTVREWRLHVVTSRSPYSEPCSPARDQ